MIATFIKTPPEVDARFTEQPNFVELTVPMTYDEYLARSEHERRAEWVNGAVTIFVPPRMVHVRLASFFVTLLRLFVHRFDLGEVVGSPVQMRRLDATVLRGPNVLFVTKAYLDRMTADRVEGAADLVIEIISDESVGRDRGDKFDEYERAGVGEYWIADPRPGRLRFDAWVRGDDQKFQIILPAADGRYHSTVVPGFWLRPDWLWQNPLPGEATLLDEIIGSVSSTS